MNEAYFTSTGGRLNLEKHLGDGGQGVVYSIKSTKVDLVFKKFNAASLSKHRDLQERLSTMVAHPPKGWCEPNSKHIVLAWPNDTVTCEGKFVGYTMPLIDTAATSELHNIANPSSRSEFQTSFQSGFTWEYLVATAKNLSRAVDICHKAGVVIGDFNERNILVGADTRITLIDCDSMQLVNPDTGQQFLTPVGRPEFNAPELLSINAGKLLRSPSSDLFGLAVHIHQLLLQGEHPFRGVWHGKGEKPLVTVLAKQGLWIHARNNLIKPRPSAVSIELLPPEILVLFRRAFVDGTKNPSLRPSASEWHAALTDLECQLHACTKVATHRYRKSLSRCPWCAHDKKITARANTQIRKQLPKPIRGLGSTAQLRSAPPKSTHKANNFRISFLSIVVLIVAGVLIFGGDWNQNTNSVPSIGSTTPSKTIEQLELERQAEQRRLEAQQRAREEFLTQFSFSDWPAGNIVNFPDSLPFNFCTRMCPSASNGVNIRLTSIAKATTEVITLEFEASVGPLLHKEFRISPRTDTNDYLLFAYQDLYLPIPGNKFGLYAEEIHLLDGNGNKYKALNGIEGLAISDRVDHKRSNALRESLYGRTSGITARALLPFNTESKFSVSFPIPNPTPSSLSFVLPSYYGQQNYWLLEIYNESSISPSLAGHVESFGYNWAEVDAIP